MNQDQDVTLKLNLINGILGYLGTRPYQEVFALVQEIQAQAIPQINVTQPTDEQETAGLND